MTVKLIRPTPYLTFPVSAYLHRVDIETEDIGATIGTRLTYAGVNGLRRQAVPLVSYRPGTRYADRAEECAVEHLAKALERAELSGRFDFVDFTTLALALADVVQEDGCQLWDPDEDGEW
ncbi:hypothetical protein [Streptomyces sp. NRRL F-5630]|uniref:hypothetical protein n=1 Tax=Streptomyces sp. NRRL F-5630 TaxID=1463864 RepID=UPI0004C7120E|nr:hypothetical protein [Streptomyces sp. NRRL F-5630]